MTGDQVDCNKNIVVFSYVTFWKKPCKCSISVMYANLCTKLINDYAWNIKAFSTSRITLTQKGIYHSFV